jgi:hypothetical protein
MLGSFAGGRRAHAGAIALAAILVARGCALPSPEEPAIPEDASDGAPASAAPPATTETVLAPPVTPVTAASAGAGPRSIARDAFVDALAAARCESVAHCCAEAGKKHDPAACASHFHGRDKWELLAKGAKAYEPGLAARCIAKLRARAASSCDVEPLGIEACARVLGGTAPKGAACETGLDCAFDPAGTAFCEKSGSTGGRCMTLVPGKAGAPCITESSVPKGDEASQCGTDPALRCDEATTTCAPRTKDGDACRVNDECFEGSRCTGRCTPTLGRTCKKATDCAGGQRCDAGTCRRGEPAGDACAVATDCARPAICDAETKKCVTPDAAHFCAAP